MTTSPIITTAINVAPHQTTQLKYTWIVKYDCWKPILRYEYSDLDKEMKLKGIRGYKFTSKDDCILEITFADKAMLNLYQLIGDRKESEHVIFKHDPDVMREKGYIEMNKRFQRKDYRKR